MERSEKLKTHFPHRIFTFVVVLTSALSTFASGFLVRDLEHYPFLVDTLASMQFPDSANHKKKDVFFGKLDSLVLCGTGKISVLHIGGSHVQADFFSHRVRCHLDSLNDGRKTSRGVFFPFSVAKTNNPLNYKVSYKGNWTTSRCVLPKERNAHFGMTGIAVSTSDTCAEISVKLNLDTASRWNFTRLRLLGYADLPCMPVITNATANTDVLPIFDKENGSYLFQFSEPKDSFTLRIRQTDSLPRNFTVCGFIAENDEDGVVYHSIGVNGAAVSSYLACENFERDLRLIKPDMVVFAIGINDAVPLNFSEERFISMYDSLITRFDAVNPDCFYVFITNNDSFRKVRKNRRIRYAVNKNGLKAEHAFRVLAEKHHGAYWDLFGWMGGLESMKKWEARGLSRKDKIHFTQKGYQLIGDYFYNALMTAYLEND